MIQNAHSIYVKVDASNMDKTIIDIEKFWTQKVDTEYPFSYDFVDKNYARTYQTYVKQRNLFSLLNMVVIIIERKIMTPIVNWVFDINTPFF